MFSIITRIREIFQSPEPQLIDKVLAVLSNTSPDDPLAIPASLNNTCVLDDDAMFIDVSCVNHAPIEEL